MLRGDQEGKSKFCTTTYSTKISCTTINKFPDPERMPRTKRLPSQERKLFGERVRAVRKAQGKTLEDVAEEADMAWSYIAQVERGERNIGIDNMAAIAQALGSPLAHLLLPAEKER